jgi:hypothetical protein
MMRCFGAVVCETEQRGRNWERRRSGGSRLGFCREGILWKETSRACPSHPSGSVHGGLRCAPDKDESDRRRDRWCRWAMGRKEGEARLRSSGPISN